MNYNEKDMDNNGEFMKNVQYQGRPSENLAGVGGSGTSVLKSCITCFP